MSGTFELFHLSLVERRQGSLFERGYPIERRFWLAKVFAGRFTFTHRRKEYHWVPLPTGSNLIAGNIARSHFRTHHTPPDEGALEVMSEEWQGALVIIDPTHHDDGQKLAFERDETAGQPRAVLASLLAHINSLGDPPYVTEPKPIFNQSSFWGWAAVHENRLKRITFDFVVPNMWGSKSELDEDLKELGAIGVQKAKLRLDSKDGIDAQGQQVRDGVEYAARGAGSVTARAENGDTFKSTDDPKTSRLPATPAERAGGIRAIAKWLPRLLGREQDDSLGGPDRGDDGSSDR